MTVVHVERVGQIRQVMVPLSTGPTGALATLMHIDFCVEVTSFTFRCFCVVMITLHLICLGFFGLQSWIYGDTSNSSLFETLRFRNIIFQSFDFLAASCCFGVIAAIHGLLVLKTLTKLNSTRSSLCDSKRRQRNWPFHRRLCSKRCGILVQPRSQIFALLFDERGFFGIRGRYFEPIYAFRKIVTILLQSAEAYRTSQLISHVSINSVVVGIIILHCWPTPLIHQASKHNRSTLRLLCIMFDLLMILITGIGTPLLVSTPYIKEFDFTMVDFPWYLYQNDTWSTVMFCEMHMVFISSWNGLVGQLTLSIAVLLCFSDVKALVLREKANKGRTKRSSVMNLNRNVTQNETKEKTNAYDNSSHQLVPVPESKQLLSISQIPFNAAITRLVKLMHVFMVGWGFVILVLHVARTFQPRSRFCVYEVHPWLSKTGCTTLRMNCSAFADFSGNMAEFTNALHGLDEQVLTTINIENCSHIEIPSTIQQFSQLQEIIITNSTIARWDADAALTNKKWRILKHSM